MKYYLCAAKYALTSKFNKVNLSKNLLNNHYFINDITLYRKFKNQEDLNEYLINKKKINEYNYLGVCDNSYYSSVRIYNLFNPEMDFWIPNNFDDEYTIFNIWVIIKENNKFYWPYNKVLNKKYVK